MPPTSYHQLCPQTDLMLEHRPPLMSPLRSADICADICKDPKAFRSVPPTPQPLQLCLWERTGAILLQTFWQWQRTFVCFGLAACSDEVAVVRNASRCCSCSCCCGFCCCCWCRVWCHSCACSSGRPVGLFKGKAHRTSNSSRVMHANLARERSSTLEPKCPYHPE